MFLKNCKNFKYVSITNKKYIYHITNRASSAQKEVKEEALLVDNVNQCKLLEKVMFDKNIPIKIIPWKKQDDLNWVDCYLEEEWRKYPFDFKAFKNFNVNYPKMIFYMRDFLKETKKGYFIFSRDSNYKINGDILMISPEEFSSIKVIVDKFVIWIEKEIKKYNWTYSIKSPYDVVRKWNWFDTIKKRINNYQKDGVKIKFAEDSYARVWYNVKFYENLSFEVPFKINKIV